MAGRKQDDIEKEKSYEGKVYDKWATVYTDGSFSKGAGGWGARVRHSRTPYKKEFLGGGSCRDSMYAEMAALVAGVALALDTWPDLKGVGIRTDCKALLKIAPFGAKSHRRKDIRYLQGLLKEALAPKCKIRVVWVKGHQGTKTAQGWCNDRVDRLASVGRARRNHR